MSVIAIVIDETRLEAQVLFELHRCLGAPLSTLKSLFTNGLPVVESEIF